MLKILPVLPKLPCSERTNNWLGTIESTTLRGHKRKEGRKRGLQTEIQTSGDQGVLGCVWKTKNSQGVICFVLAIRSLECLRIFTYECVNLSRRRVEGGCNWLDWEEAVWLWDFRFSLWAWNTQQCWQWFRWLRGNRMSYATRQQDLCGCGG